MIKGRMISKPTAFCQKKKFLGKPEAANEAFEDCSFQQLRCAQIECLKLCLYITCTSWDCGNVSCGCLNWELQNPLSCYFALAFVIYMTHVLVVGFFFFLWHFKHAFLLLLTHKRHIICFMCMSLSQSPTKCTFHSCMCLHIVIALCTFVLRFCVCNSRAGTFLKHYLLSWQPWHHLYNL